VGLQIRILQLNIEGISRSKCDYLSRLLVENNITVLVLQETHAENASNLSSKGHIKGFTLASAIYNKQYGSATYIRNSISNWEHILTSDVNNNSLIKIKIEENNIINV
jgi:exonuclease III